MTPTTLICPLPVHPVWGTALAVLDNQPVWPVLGGADDDDDGPEIDLENPGGAGSGGSGHRDFLDDDPDDDDEPEDDGPSTKDDPAKKNEAVDDWKPPSREEWERTQKALADANKEAGDKRRKLREARQTQRKAEPKPEAGTVDAARAEAAAETEARLKPIAIKATAKAALLAANFQNPTETRLKRLIGRMDMSEIEIDEDGEIIGLDEEVERLQDEFPELFTAPAPAEPAATRGKPRPPKINPADKKDAPPVFVRTADKIAAQILGNT